MERGSGWVQTFTGAQFWPSEPRVEDIRIEDIAHALAMQCRFNGHCRRFYSVGKPSAYALKKQFNTIKRAEFRFVYDVAKTACERVFSKLPSTKQEIH